MLDEAIFHIVYFFLVWNPAAPYYCWLPATGIAIYCGVWVFGEWNFIRRIKLTERPNRIDMVLRARLDQAPWADKTWMAHYADSPYGGYRFRTDPLPGVPYDARGIRREALNKMGALASRTSCPAGYWVKH